METKLSELEEGSLLLLRIYAKGKTLQLNAVLKKHLRENFAQITLSCDTSKKLNFDNVNIDMEFYPDGNVPIKWYNVKIVYHESDYVLQVFTDGARYNRRNYFRVGVSASANLKHLFPRGPRQVTIRDISLTGFSVSDRKKELSLKIGDMLSVTLDDLGYTLDLTGRVVRIEECDDVTIYGFVICNVCNDLSSYVTKKQRQKK